MSSADEIVNVTEGIAILHGILLREVRGSHLFRAALVLEKVAKLYAESVDDLYDCGLKCHALTVQTVELENKDSPRPSEPSGALTRAPAKEMWVPELIELKICSRTLLTRPPPMVELLPRDVLDEVMCKYFFCSSDYGFPPIYLVSGSERIDKDQFACNALRFSDEESSDFEEEVRHEEEQNIESSSEEEFFDLYPPDYCETQDDEDEQLYPADFGYHFLAPLPEPEEVVKENNKKTERKKRAKKVMKPKQKEKIKRFKFMNLDVTHSNTEKRISTVDFDSGNVPCSSANYDTEHDNYQSEENLEAPRRKRPRKRRKVITNESGICMNLYRKKVLELFVNSRDGTIDFCKDLKFQGCREVSLHFLAVLHLVNENKIKIVTQPLTVNYMKIIRLEDS